MNNIRVRHRFIDYRPHPETELLIIGTFNPETPENPADFFYGRSRNHLWRLLPAAFGKESLKGALKEDKLRFMRMHKIDFIDLIAEVEAEPGQEANYRDDYIDCRVQRWRAIIPELESLKKLRKVALSRKTFSGIPHIKRQVDSVAEYCRARGIHFQLLPTPARIYSNEKQAAWTKFLRG
jgi:hypothetical protein